jgi:hypothetical protein
VESSSRARCASRRNQAALHEFRKPLHGFVRIRAVGFQGGDRAAVEVRTHHINQAGG